MKKKGIILCEICKKAVRQDEKTLPCEGPPAFFIVNEAAQELH